MEAEPKPWYRTMSVETRPNRMTKQPNESIWSLRMAIGSKGFAYFPEGRLNERQWPAEANHAILGQSGMLWINPHTPELCGFGRNHGEKPHRGAY